VSPLLFAAVVLIQAGHEGRPDCKPNGPEPLSLCHNTGQGTAPGEIAWTPIVANEATRVLRDAGVTVTRTKAYVHGIYHVSAAVFIHFDGAAQACSAGASVGYPPDSARSKHLATAWKALYGKYWPGPFKPDNYTSHEAGYYAFRHVIASDGMFLFEGGEMSCPRQYAWLAKNLKWEGDLLAYFLSRELHQGNVPFPGPPRLSS
jgi:hypothetical protein